MRRLNIRHPVAHSLVDGILQRAAARIHTHHLCAQQPHAKHIQPLPLHIFGAHVHPAGKPQQRRDRGGGDAVLARARFRDHALFAHPHGEQPLAQAIVDLVRTSVQQILSLDVDARAAALFGEPRSELQRRRPPGEIVQQLPEPRVKFRIRAGFGVSALEFFERRHQRFGDVTPAIRPVAPSCVRHNLCCGTHRPPFRAF